MILWPSGLKQPEGLSMRAESRISDRIEAGNS